MFGVATLAKGNKVVEFSFIFPVYVCPLQPTKVLTAPLTLYRIAFPSLYPSMQCMITNCVSFPVTMFFTCSYLSWRWYVSFFELAPYTISFSYLIGRRALVATKPSSPLFNFITICPELFRTYLTIPIFPFYVVRPKKYFLHPYIIARFAQSTNQPWPTILIISSWTPL